MIKKITIILLVLTLIGCSANKEDISSATYTTNVDDTNNDMYVLYVEEVENYPTSIELKNDGSFKSELNVCTGIVEVSGTYVIDEDRLFLSFLEKTGFEFLDNGQPFIFIMNNDKLIQEENNEVYSCAYVNTYVRKQGE